MAYMVRTMNERLVRVGLTGGIAAGKSTVAARMRALGVPVIDYDELARVVVAPGSAGLRRIVEEFGVRALGTGRSPRPGVAGRTCVRCECGPRG